MEVYSVTDCQNMCTNETCYFAYYGDRSECVILSELFGTLEDFAVNVTSGMIYQENDTGKNCVQLMQPRGNCINGPLKLTGFIKHHFTLVCFLLAVQSLV